MIMPLNVGKGATISMRPALMSLKLMPPQSRGVTLARPALQALLSEVRLQPVTLVVAPAGYGKTTLLAQWASELTRTGTPVCWVTLDEGDRDPALQLAYLVRTFQLRLPGIGDQAWRILHSAVQLERDWPLVAGALCSDLQAMLTHPTFLFLDDLHLIAEGPITSQLLGYMLRAAPPMLHIVLASRRPINFAPIPRLRAENSLMEMSQHDLSFNTCEVRLLLEQSGVYLEQHELQLLMARTEGWALSVQLAARALAQHPAPQRTHFLQTMGETQQESGLLDYLASEVLADLPPDLLQFLSLAALPEQFDVPLLEEVLAQHNVGSLLARAQQMGLPLVSVERKEQLAAFQRDGTATERLGTTTFRFHPLWRELLLRQAQTFLNPTDWATYQCRFGHAQERRDNLEAALHHYARAGNTDEIIRALREQAWPLIDSPQRDTIRRWIEQLPEEVRSSDPELLHMWGWSQCVLAPNQAATAISAAAEIYRLQGLPQRELRALSDLAALLFWEDCPDDFAAICIRAVRAANRVRDAWARGAALVSVVALLYNRGRYQAALRVARHATQHPRNSFWQWLLALIVSDIAIQQGSPTTALLTIEEALAVPQIDRDDRLRQNLLRQQAMALYQSGQSTEAMELALATHASLSNYYNNGAIGASATLVALLLIDQDRGEEAATYLAQARMIAHHTGAAPLLTRVQALEVYATLRTEPVQLSTAAALDALRALDDSEDVGHSLWLRLLLIITLGESGAINRAAQLIQEVIAQMHARGDGLFLVIAHLYHARLAQHMGDEPARLAALRAGWELAETRGYAFLPFLPPSVLQAAVLGALQQGLAPHTTAVILRRQLPQQATSLLVGLLKDSSADTRARSAILLGELGATTAYTALRSLLRDRTLRVRAAAEDALESLVYRPSYTLRVRMLGAFTVWRGAEEVRDRDWRSIKSRQLLQLLLIEQGRMLPRERIMDTLWPGLDPEAAANNLRVTLSRLTRALEPERPEGVAACYILQQGDTYGFNIESDYQLDSTDFAAEVAHGQEAEYAGRSAAAIAAYRRAITLYGGVLLPDSLYEDWTVVERERLSLLFNKAALRLGTLLLAEGLPHEAIGLAWRVIGYDQAQEEAYQLLMRAHMQLGERSTALRLFKRCVAALRSELGVEPLRETLALYETLRGIDEDSG